MEGQITTYGEIAYDAYCEAVGGKTWDDRDIPAWKDLTDKIRAAWEAGAEAAISTHIAASLA